MLTETDFFEAVATGNAEIIQKAIDENKVIDENFINRLSFYSGNTALHLATAFCHVEVVALLIANQAKLDTTNSTGITPLRSAMFALRNDSTEEKKARLFEIMKMLLKAGAKPTYLDQGEEKYLYYAAPKRLQREVANIFVEQLGAVAMMIEKIPSRPSSSAPSSSSHPVERNSHQEKNTPASISLWDTFTGLLFSSSKPAKNDDETKQALLSKKNQ